MLEELRLVSRPVLLVFATVLVQVLVKLMLQAFAAGQLSSSQRRVIVPLAF